MDMTGQVALWVGLISSVVSIVLSIVAIVFAIIVDRGARAVTAQTIKSLQKIESDVERLSSDTRELIKAGWDKMLGTVPGQEAPSIEGGAKEIAAGVAAELRAELATLAAAKVQPDRASAEHDFDDLVKRLEQSLAAQIKAEAIPDRASLQVEQARSLLIPLSPLALALAAEMQRYHLTRRQYLALAKGPLADAIRELRATGLLVPASGFGKDGKEIPVYYFPPRMTRAIRAALSFVAPPSPEFIETASTELKRVGYFDRDTA